MQGNSTFFTAQQHFLHEAKKAALEKAERLGLSFVSLEEEPPRITDAQLSTKLSHVLPLSWQTGRLKVAVADPEEENTKEELKNLEKEHHLIVCIAAEEEMKAYKKNTVVKPRHSENKIVNIEQLESAPENSTGAELMQALVEDAIKERASDIHLQPVEGGHLLRLRVDGKLKQAHTIPAKKATELMRQIKYTAGIKINITDVPQDGSLELTIKGNKVELRVATLPSKEGEVLTLRVLDAQSHLLRLESLGLFNTQHAILRKALMQTEGLILVAGPTGSGKSTTLYAMLQEIQNPEKNIITLEDPIEYRLPGITQSHIDGQHMSFAQGLRSIVRHDPDIILVGEIRDSQTAEAAVTAALTGHLVLSSVHANSAADVFPRMMQLGVSPFSLARSTKLVVSQRLVRKGVEGSAKKTDCI